LRHCFSGGTKCTIKPSSGTNRIGGLIVKHGSINVLKSSNAAVAPAIFGPWMNISGSVLATWWHHHPVRDQLQPHPEDRP
jgi:hypothetical protein